MSKSIATCVRPRASTLGWLVAVSSLLAAGCGTSPETPDVIVIVVDTLRADHLGSYGFDGPISPNLDRFAEESVVFTRCFSQAPWTKPAVASLITSLYPQVHRLTVLPGDDQFTQFLNIPLAQVAHRVAAPAYIGEAP